MLRLSSCAEIRFLLHVRYYIPGDDNGSYEDPFLAWSVFVNSRNIQMAMYVGSRDNDWLLALWPL